MPVVKPILYLLHRLLHWTSPIPDGTEVFKANRYIADQSPLLMEEPSGFFAQYSETHPRTSLREQPQPGFADGPPGVL